MVCGECQEKPEKKPVRIIWYGVCANKNQKKKAGKYPAFSSTCNFFCILCTFFIFDISNLCSREMFGDDNLNDFATLLC